MLGLHFTLSLAFYPRSAVCSPRFTLTGFPPMQYLPSFINVLILFFFVSLKMVVVPTVKIHDTAPLSGFLLSGSNCTQ